MLKFLKRFNPISMGNIDKQIYQDIYSAQELLLAEANKVLSAPNEHSDERLLVLKGLVDLGFSNAEQVKEFKEVEDKKEEQQWLKEKIEYYKHTYPLNKFIDEQSVKVICEKYGLLLTRGNDYISDIPESNQKEIVLFKVKRGDIREPIEVYEGLFFPPRAFGSLVLSATERDKFDEEMIKGQNLLIVAPSHKLDLRGKEIKGHIVKIKDPIVLQPVKKGYLIVSSWGLEASDELVMNPINN